MDGSSFKTEESLALERFMALAPPRLDQPTINAISAVLLALNDYPLVKLDYNLSVLSAV
jgi:hypothetical protein